MVTQVELLVLFGTLLIASLWVDAESVSPPELSCSCGTAGLFLSLFLARACLTRSFTLSVSNNKK
jgi:hypothetical protein